MMMINNKRYFGLESLRLRLIVAGLSFLSVYKLFRFHTTLEPEASWRARLLQDVVGGGGVKLFLPPCKVLISNHRVTFHTEILESLMAKFPTTSLSLPDTCDHSTLEFDFILRKKLQAESWYEYFKDEMANKVYSSIQEKRIARQASFADSKEFHYIAPIKENYDATIESSCYCNKDFIELVLSSSLQTKKTICIFHESCDVVKDNPRAFWVSPHHDRYVFPSVLPMAPSSHIQSPTLPIELCVIGASGRRNWRLLSDFLDTVDLQNLNKTVRINLFGRGEFPDALEKYKNLTRQESIMDFRDFQQSIAQSCNVLLPLIDFKVGGSYFNRPEDKKKLSGTIVQAVAYSIPMVIHEDLAQLYVKEHPQGTPWETHTNNAETFTAALTKMVEALGNVTLNITGQPIISVAKRQ